MTIFFFFFREKPIFQLGFKNKPDFFFLFNKTADHAGKSQASSTGFI